MSEQTLSLSDATALAAILGWAQTNADVIWLNEAGVPTFGTADFIGTMRGGMPSGTDDVRDCCLYLVTTDGQYVSLSMTDAIKRYRACEFMRNA